MAVVTLLAAAAGPRPRAAARAPGPQGRPWRLVLIFAAVNLAIALLALPYIPGNPRYLLFLMAALPVLLAEAPGGRAGRVVLALVVATGALASLAQAAGAAAADGQWRALRARAARGGRPLLLHGLPPGHARSTSSPARR